MNSRCLIFVLSLLFLAPLLWGYGPRSVTSAGTAVKWTMPVRIDLESDLDVRGKDVSALLSEGLSQWSSVADAAVSYDQQALGEGIDGSNVCCYLYDGAACPNGSLTDGLNPIVIDDDGLVVAKFFGTGNRFTTLGFAAIIYSDPDTGAAVKGEAVFNAACLAGVEMDGCGTLSFSDQDFISFIAHEIGHFLGLNHSQVNFEEADDDDTSNDDLITTMYPYFVQGNGANFKTPERDDEVGLAVLYPASHFASTTFTVAGTVSDADGEFACANVVARNSDSSLARIDAVSFVSGQMCPSGIFDGSCDGNYQIQGLNPSYSYTFEVEAIDSGSTGPSGIPPCEGTGGQPAVVSQTLPGSVSGTANATTTGVNFTVTTAGSLVLQPLDSSPPSSWYRSVAYDAIVALEEKSATSSSCTTATTTTDDDDDDSTTGSGSSCSLIRNEKK